MRINPLKIIATSAFAAALFSAPVLAGGDAPDISPPDEASDVVIMTQTALLLSEVNGLEIESSQVAISMKGVSSSTKTYARMLIEHHQLAQAQLMQVSNAAQLELDAAVLDSDLQQRLDALRDQWQVAAGATGHAFEHAYLDLQITAHRDSIAMLKEHDALMSAPDAIGFKGYIQSLIPQLELHLEEAIRLQEKASEHHD